MVIGVVGVDQDVIEVDEKAYIQEISVYTVHTRLESSRSIRKTERHNTPLKGTIAGTEGSLPFVPFVDPDKVVCMLEIDLCKELGLTRAIQEVGDAWESVSVFLRDSIKAPEVDTELQGAIFLLDE